MFLFKFDSKFILRISGFPKLNIVRKNFWKHVSTKLYCITSPSEELKKNLIKLNIFQEKKIYFLPDAIININNFRKQIKTENKFNNIEYLLFDYKPAKNELPGGNSKSLDWNLLKGKEIKLPWFISGGINETNIKKIQK